MFLLTRNWSSTLGWLSNQKLPSGAPATGHIRFHSRGFSRADITFARCRVLSACRTSESSKGSSLKSPMASSGGGRAVHLEHPLVEVAERLAGDGAVAGRLVLASAAAGPVVAEHRPGPAGRGGAEVDLDDLAGGVAAHHHVEEHRLLERCGDLEQGVVVDEGHVDAAGVLGVGVHHPVAARGGKRGVHGVDETVDHEPVLDLADAEEVRPPALVHARDDRGELVDLAVAQPRRPAGDVALDGAEHLVGASAQRDRVLLVEEVLEVPPGDVIVPHTPSSRVVPEDRSPSTLRPASAIRQTRLDPRGPPG